MVSICGEALHPSPRIVRVIPAGGHTGCSHLLFVCGVLFVGKSTRWKHACSEVWGVGGVVIDGDELELVWRGGRSVGVVAPRAARRGLLASWQAAARQSSALARTLASSDCGVKMGKMNSCLKCLFVFFNVVFAIIGCLLIFGAVKASVFSAQLSAVGAPGLGWVWVFAIGVLGISCLGIYAGISEKELALKIFAGFMAVGMIIMLIFGIVVVVMRNKVRESFRSTSAEVAKPFMAEEGFRTMLQQLQESGHCCGLVSASDWGDDIPGTCECRPGLDGYGGFGTFGHSGCKARPQGTTGPEQVYQQSCGELIVTYVDYFFNIAIGFLFGFAITALLGLLVALLMIHQVRRHDQAGASSVAMKSY